MQWCLYDVSSSWESQNATLLYLLNCSLSSFSQRHLHSKVTWSVWSFSAKQRQPLQNCKEKHKEEFPASIEPLKWISFNYWSSLLVIDNIYWPFLCRFLTIYCICIESGKCKISSHWPGNSLKGLCKDLWHGDVIYIYFIYLYFIIYIYIYIFFFFAEWILVIKGPAITTFSCVIAFE